MIFFKISLRITDYNPILCLERRERPLYFFLPSLPIGLLVGYIYLKQRRLLPLIIAHVGINLIPNMMVLLPKYFPDLLPYWECEHRL